MQELDLEIFRGDEALLLEEIAEEEDHLLFELGRGRPRGDEALQPGGPIRRHRGDVVFGRSAVP